MSKESFTSSKLQPKHCNLDKYHDLRGKGVSPESIYAIHWKTWKNLKNVILEK